jgi:hypothetical protein
LDLSRSQDADLVLMLNAVPVDALAARIGQAFELDT